VNVVVVAFVCSPSASTRWVVLTVMCATINSAQHPANSH